MNRKEIRRMAFVGDVDTGGATIAGQRLASAMTATGVETIWVYGEARAAPRSFSAMQWPHLARYLAFRVAAMLPAPESRCDYLRRRCTSHTVAQAVRRFQPDVISLHNVHKTMDVGLVEQLTAIAPVVWTLHDMWALTGYCCYSHECRQYERGCGRVCPEAGRWGPTPNSAQLGWQRREAMFRRVTESLSLITPSQWLLECVGSRNPAVRTAKRIANGCDLNVFCPIADKIAVRSMLGLAKDEAKIVLVGGQSLNDRRKGVALALDALQKVAGELRITVLTFGSASPEIAPSTNLAFHHLGPVVDDRYLNLAYNAADVFVLPTRADNLPNTLVESIAAGTPCVASNIGGCREIVRDAETGRLAVPGNVGSLSEALKGILSLSRSDAEAMRRRCRKVAESDYSADRQAAAYLSFMESCM